MNNEWEFIEREKLHRAAERGNLKEVKQLVMQGFPLNEFDSDLFWTPLHYAAKEEHKDIVLYLLEKGANVNSYCEEKIGETPLGLIADKCSYEMAEMLVEWGANPKIKGWMNLTSIDRAEKRKDPVGRQVFELLKYIGDNFFKYSIVNEISEKFILEYTIFDAGLKMGIVDRERIAKWADSYIVGVNHINSEIINISLAAEQSESGLIKSFLDAAIAWNIPPNAFFQHPIVSKCLLANINAAFINKRIGLRELISKLKTIHINFFAEQIFTDKISSNLIYLDDAYDLAIYEKIGTVENVDKEAEYFLSTFQNFTIFLNFWE
ncbi:MAG: ankyrin repeat domain-containing protein [Pseudomonadota bacterium]